MHKSIRKLRLLQGEKVEMISVTRRAVYTKAHLNPGQLQKLNWNTINLKRKLLHNTALLSTASCDLVGHS